MTLTSVLMNSPPNPCYLDSIEVKRGNGIHSIVTRAALAMLLLKVEQHIVDANIAKWTKSRGN